MKSLCFLSLLLLLALPCPTFAQTLTGKVVGLSDGGTIIVLDADRPQHKIRLNGIDAPESNQDFGQISKRHLSDLIFGKDVVVIWRKQDKYGRILGKVVIHDMNVNLAQIRLGMAWFYRRYSSDLDPADRATYDKAEQEARAARRGLWQQPNPTPPWEWRHPEQATGNREAKSPRFAQNPSGQVIGNRNSRVYHRPDCPDYHKVSERNRIYFATTTEAERAGFRRAGNCPK